jgi:O-antigen/teichoic acid export membrane protein
LRYLAVTLVPGAALIAVMGPELVTLLYPASYREGGAWLQALGPAYAAWTAAYLLAIAFAGAGSIRTGVAVLSVGLVGQVAAGFVLCQRFGPRGAAYGDLVGMGLAFALGTALAVRRFGAIVPWPSVARGAALALVLALAARAWPAAGLAVALKVAALAAGGAFLLFVSGELPRAKPRWAASDPG